jgi:FtsP/CotA-like multicopper oxidase with cupredoxin domain
MEEAMDGGVGNTVTINGHVTDVVRVRAGERVRLRLLNAAPARIMALRFEGHLPVIVALDGRPAIRMSRRMGGFCLGRRCGWT